MNYGDFKDVPRRTASDKLLGKKAFNTAESAQYDGHRKYFGSMVYSFFDRRSSGGANSNYYRYICYHAKPATSI